MLDTTQTTGLVCGYRVDAAGEMRELAWDDMDAALSSDDSVWLHFNQADVPARDWIATTPHIPGAGKKILLGDDTHMRIDVCGNGLAGVVGDLHHEFVEDAAQLGVLRLYIDNHCLISSRRQPLQAVEKLRTTIGDGLKVEKPIAIITQFLHHVTDTFDDLLAKLVGDVDELEERLLAGQIAGRVPELARVRRIAARLRRHMVPQHHALASLALRLPGWVGESDAASLRNAIERLCALGHDLELVQERARLVGDQLSSRLMEDTNRNLYMLAIVTTIFLPMTLVTGIFGMNLGGMPGQSHPLGFWYGMAFMVVLGLGTAFFLRRVRIW